ncbi:transposase, partial [Staphylococcus pettenkoferi]
KKLNAFVGIDVAHYQSGNNEKKDFINRRGNRHCRKILYNKHHKVAIGACMNQFLEVIHFLYKHNLRYDYNLATAQ